jgi:DNA polymerase (family 10)
MKNQDVARIFNELAELLELKGENPFRIRAYRRAAQNVEGLPKDIAETSEEELLKLPGIGKDLAGKIREIVDTGSLKAYEDIRREIPEGLSAVLSVPGIGPKTAKLLYDKLHIKDLDDLERLARGHRLKGLPGIKAKTEENILKGIATLRRGRERTPLGIALPIAEDVLERIKKNAPVKKIALAGSIRRFKETVKDIDILCTSSNADKVMKLFVKLPNVRDVIAHGPTKSSVALEEGIQVDLRVVDAKAFGSALAYFTGSKAHNIRLREMAMKKGLKINEYGVFREKDEKRIGGEKEEDIYRILGLQFVPPELREDSGEVEAAQKGKLPKLLVLKDIKGDLHVHTKRSDGSHTLKELVEAARERGYKYIAITDHTKGLGVAGGLDEVEVLEQIKEIDALNKKLRGFKLLKGTEVDIRSDYTLDLPDEILRKLDIVVASIHSGFRQTSEKLTRRLVAAMENPHVSVIAHPTGRLLGKRDAYDIDIEEVLETAARTGTSLEINAYPLRLDLGDVNARAAAGLSAKISIGTDTHILRNFDYMSYGVGIARRGWLEKKDVLNTLDIEALMKTLRAKRPK